MKKKTDGGDYEGRMKEEKKCTAVWSSDKHSSQVKRRRRETEEKEAK